MQEQNILSKNKKDFIATYSNNVESYQLKASELKNIVTFYSKKYDPDFEIIINGETEFGKNCINNKKGKLKEELSDFNDEKTKYSAYLVKFWCPPGLSTLDNTDMEISNQYFSSFCDVYKQIQNKIHPFLKKDFSFKDLNKEDKNTLNEIFLNDAEMSTTKKLLDTSINNYIERQNNSINDLCLTKKEAMEEVKRIQETLPEGKSIGYIFKGLTH